MIFEVNISHCFSTDAQFGRMIIQIPVQNGYKGGQLKVKHNGLVEKFNVNFLESQNAFHVAVFFSDCDLELEPITHGCMLALMFNLSWKCAFPLHTLSVGLPQFLKMLAKTENAIKSWILEKQENYKQESIENVDSASGKLQFSNLTL